MKKSTSGASGINREDVRLMPHLSTTTSTAPAISAGRELDALVAEKVFGLVQCQCLHHDGHFPNTYCYARPESPTQGGEVKEFSTDIAAAWEVVEKVMEREGMYFELERNSVRGTQWRVTFSPYSQPVIVALGPTAPLAICLAALKAVA